MNGQKGIVRAQCNTAVYDFLTAALHFRILTLHRGVIQSLVAATRGHARGSTTAKPNQQAGATQNDQQTARRHRLFADLPKVDRSKPSGQHNGLVVGAQLSIKLLFETPEITSNSRAPEFVVVGTGAKRPLDHDFQGPSQVLGVGPLKLPRPQRLRQAQIRHRETGDGSLGPGSTASRALVANFSTRPRRGPSVR